MRNSFVLIVSAIIILRKRARCLARPSISPICSGGRSLAFWADHPVLCLQPCGAGRCDDPEQNFPYLVTILAVIFMKEKLPKIQIPALALSMVGASSCSAPALSPTPSRWWWHFVGRDSGVAYTFLSFFKGKVDGLTVMMHFSTFSAIALSPSC